MGKQNELKKLGEIYRELRLDKGTNYQIILIKDFLNRNFLDLKEERLKYL